MTRPAPLKVAVLVSGEGTNLQTLIDEAKRPSAKFSVAAVFCDRADARALRRARSSGIPVEFVDPRAYGGREAFDDGLAAGIRRADPGLIVLAGFMRILGPKFIREFGDRTLNIHPSLLPKFKGLHTHRRVLDARESEHGATVHFVTVDLDGGPAVVQYRIDVRRGDTEASLSARVHEGEHIILPKAVDWFASGRLALEAGSAVLDGTQLEQPVRIDGAT